MFSKFDMKDLKVTKSTLGMELERDQASIRLWLSQIKYVEIDLKCFNMHESRLVKVPIPMGVKLSVE